MIWWKIFITLLVCSWLFSCNAKFLRMRNDAYSSYSSLNKTNSDQNGKRNSSASPQIAFKKVDETTYFVFLKPKHVLEVFLMVLVKNYTINIIDHTSNLISTDWDSYYVDHELFRNKITIKLTKMSPHKTKIDIINNIEKFDKPFSYSTSENIWVPFDKKAEEIERIITNVKTILKRKKKTTSFARN